MSCWKCKYFSRSQRLLVKHIVKKHTKYVLQPNTYQRKDDNIEKKNHRSRCLTDKQIYHSEKLELLKNGSCHMEEVSNQNRPLLLCYKDHQVDKTIGANSQLNNETGNHNKTNEQIKTENQIQEEMEDLNEEEYIQASYIHDNNRKSEHFICKYCNASLNNKKQYEYHMEIHYNVQDDDRYNCDVCGVNFNTKFEMKQHKRKHFNRCHKKKHIKDGRNINRNYMRHRRQKSCIDNNSEEYSFQ